MPDSTIGGLTNKSIIADTDILVLVEAPYTSDDNDKNINGAQLKENVQDWVAAFVNPGSGVLKNYDDAGNLLNLSADPEYIRDTIAAALQTGTGVTVTNNDGADTITLSLTDEDLQDKIAAFLAAGANVTISYNDGANTLTISGAAGATADVIEQLTAVTSPASPWTMPNGTGSRFQQVTTSGALTISKSTNGFTSGQLEVFLLRLVASGGDIAITWDTGISLGQGVAISKVPSGTYRDIILQTRDGGSTFYYDGDPRDVRTITLPLSALITDDQATASPCPFAEFAVPASLNGYSVISARVDQSTAGTTSASTYMPRRVRSGTGVDICSADISVSSTAESATGTINSGNAGLQTGDKLRVNITGLSTTKPKGGELTLEVANG